LKIIVSAHEPVRRCKDASGQQSLIITRECTCLTDLTCSLLVDDNWVAGSFREIKSALAEISQIRLQFLCPRAENHISEVVSSAEVGHRELISGHGRIIIRYYGSRALFFI